MKLYETALDQDAGGVGFFTIFLLLSFGIKGTVSRDGFGFGDMHGKL
jgi:hypothetical protein